MKRLLAWMTLIGGLVTGPAFAQDTDVLVELEQFGVGSAYRPGDIAAARLKLTGNRPEAVEVWVQWQVPNADGDIAEYGRSLTVNRSSDAGRLVWLYAMLPPETRPTDVWPVVVFEMTDGVRGRELGGTHIGPSIGNAVAVDIDKGMVGVVGPLRMRLDDLNFGQVTASGPPPAHETMRVISNIKPAELPDRWDGLRCFEAIAWADASPDELRDDPANALRQYIQRGGHFIISLGSAGDPWDLAGGQRTPLWDLLPPMPRKDEDVALSALLPVLSKSDVLPDDLNMTIHVFKDVRGGFDALEGSYYEPVLTMPDGRVVAVQRTYGFGRITVIGVDLSDQRMNRKSIPQGDAFWNRILGRRADTPTGSELRAISDAKRRSERFPAERTVGSGSLFSQQIAMSQEAGVGLLLAALLFIVYFLVAGPPGFFVLKAYKQVRHAWLVFVAAAGLFTGMAWGAVSLIRVNEINVKHVTYLDYIARPGGDRPGDPQLYRAASWLSVYLPGYRPTRVAIDSDDTQRDLLASWAPPGEPRQTFPNVDRYTIDVARGSEDYLIPARSTSTQLYAHWMGGPEEAWAGMFQVEAEPIRPIEPVPAPQDSPLSGTIRHSLPGDLTNVKIFYITSGRAPRRRYAPAGDGDAPWVPESRSGDLLNYGKMWALPGALAPDQSYRLEDLLTQSRQNRVGPVELARSIDDAYVKKYQKQSLTGFIGPTATPLNPQQQRDFMEMLGIFSQLTPPKYLRSPSDTDDPETLLARRELAREIDLSPWFTRPCLIIVGYVENQACPVPLRVADNRTPNSEGLTIVRWLYPLPLDEEAAFREVFEEEQADAGFP